MDYSIQKYPDRFELVLDESEKVHMHHMSVQFHSNLVFSREYLRENAKKDLWWAWDHLQKGVWIDYPLEWSIDIEKELLLARVIHREHHVFTGPSEDEYGERTTHINEEILLLEYSFPLSHIPSLECSIPLCVREYFQDDRYGPKDVLLVIPDQSIARWGVVAKWSKSLGIWKADKGQRWSNPRLGVSALSPLQRGMLKVQGLSLDINDKYLPK